MRVPFGSFIRMIFKANVPINRNTAKIAHAPGCTGFGLEVSRAKLARKAPRDKTFRPMLQRYANMLTQDAPC